MREKTLALIILVLGAGPASAIRWTGFGGVSLSRGSSSAGEPTRAGAFGLDELALHLNEELDDRVSVMAELALEIRDAGEAALDIERYCINYRRSDLLTLSAGRMHNVLGYWNTAYHHGSFLKTTIGNPLFLRFEHDGVIPLHLTGAAVEGRWESEPGVLRYRMLAGNGPRLTGVGADDAHLVPGDMADDRRNGRAAAFNLTFQPEALAGAGFGVSGHFISMRGYNDAAPTVEAARIRQDAYGAHLHLIAERPEILAEVYRFQDKGLSGPSVGPSRGAMAYYAQASYGLGKNGAYRPYLRHEGLSRRDDDPLFSIIGFQSYHRWTAGVKWTMAVRSALKLEWRWHHRSGAEFSEEALQWSFSF